MKNKVFTSFTEYWHYARYLSQDQRTIIFDSLTPDQQESLEASYTRGRWSDVFFRNEIDNILDELKDKYGYDLLEIKGKIFKGKSVYIPSNFWKVVMEYVNKYNSDAMRFVIGGITATKCKQNSDVMLLTVSEIDV